MTFPEGQGWQTGGAHGPAGSGPFYGEPGPPGPAGAHPGGSGGGSGNQVLLVGLTIVAVVLIAVLGVLGYVIVSAGGDPKTPAAPASAASSTEAETSTTESPTSSAESPTSAESSPESSSAAPAPQARFPEVRPAADLPADQKEKLGSQIQLHVSDLRYREIDVFAKTYACMFSVDIVNLTDQPRTIDMGFRVVGEPAVAMGGGRPTEIDADSTKELVLGWEATSPEELEIAPDRCTGPVELTMLVVE